MQEFFFEREIVSIAVRSQYAPCRLESGSLDEHCVKVEKSAFCQAALVYEIRITLLDDFFDSLNFTRLQRRGEAFSLQRIGPRILAKVG